MRSHGRAVPDADGEVMRVVGSLVDIDAQMQLRSELERRASHDPLTGLANRELFLAEVERALVHSARSGEARYAIVFIDLDRFKMVNDSLGHAAGDRLLVALAGRITAAVREGDLVARIGGDEFTLLLHDVDDLAHARRVVARLEDAMALPLDLGGHEIHVTASIGIVMGTRDAHDPLALLRDADLAMFSVKRIPGVTVGVFDVEMRTPVKELLTLDNELARALARGDIQPWYQPIVDLRTGEPVGFEALARWVDPNGKVRRPDEFIPRAEVTGAIGPLDRAIFREAAARISALPDPVFLSVNLSARHFHREGLAEWLTQEAAAADLSLRRVQIEITEAVLLVDLPEVHQKLSDLRSAGAMIALDDFGKGYSALSYLDHFSLDVLKLDISFVQERGEQGPGPICAAIQTMATALGIRTLAEGVETEAQRQALIDLGCTLGQGYLFGAPAPQPELKRPA